MTGSGPLGAESAAGQGGIAAAAPARVWDTREVPGKEAFAYYRDGICEAFMELAPEDAQERERPFRARVEHLPLATAGRGQGALNRVRASSHLVLRTPRQIAAAPEECFYLNLKTEGQCLIRQAGGEVLLRPGDVGLFSSAAPFALAHPRPTLGVASFRVPRQALEARLPSGLADVPCLLSGHPLLGGLIREAAQTLADGAEHLPAADAERLFGMLLDLAAMALSPGQAPAVDGRRARAEAAFLAMRRHVERHLAEPGYSLDRLAAAFGLSRRAVQKLFAAHGTSFSAFLLERRLARTAAALRAPARAHLPVTSLALDAGFSDLSHFSRAFKARYGRSPGAWRRGQG